MNVLPDVDTFVKTAIAKNRPVPVTILRERAVYDYPKWPIRELMMNAIMHRDYRSTGPTMFYQYADRIELLNSGGLYGRVNRENFPDENDYRNPIIADAMRTLGYVNRFGRGIGRVHIELEENGNGEPLFDVGQIGSFKVTVGLTKYADIGQSAAESSQRTAQSKETRDESSQRLPESSQKSNERAEKDTEREGVSLRGGLEFEAVRNFFIRAGVQTNPGILSFGLGYAISFAQVNVAAQLHNELSIGK